MTPSVTNRCASALCVAAMAASCSSPSAPTFTTRAIPTVAQPSAIAEAPPSASIGAGRTVTITNGWTGDPLSSARVSVDGNDYFTDADGTFPLTIVEGKCLRLDIVATGFLQRRTCARRSVTLWPIADQAEMEATHDAAFPYSDRLFDQSRGMNDQPVVLADHLESRSEVTAAWNTAATEMASATGGKLTVRFARAVPGGEGYLVSVAPSSPPCMHRWFTWQFSIAGFCWELTPDYFVQDIAVAPSLVDHPDIALRALLYAFTLRPHQLPGLMNVTRPATELSSFERKTLHMMSLRWPASVTWPDLENTP